MIDNKITANSTKLMDQAPSTISRYMMEAVKMIDLEFGTGYAKEHPELVGAFIQSASIDFASGLIAQSLQYIAESIEEQSE